MRLKKIHTILRYFNSYTCIPFIGILMIPMITGLFPKIPFIGGDLAFEIVLVDFVCLIIFAFIYGYSQKLTENLMNIEVISQSLPTVVVDEKINTLINCELTYLLDLLMWCTTTPWNSMAFYFLGSRIKYILSICSNQKQYNITNRQICLLNRVSLKENVIKFVSLAPYESYRYQACQSFRKEAIYALGYIGNSESILVLEKCSSVTESPEIRDTAATALNQLKQDSKL